MQEQHTQSKKNDRCGSILNIMGLALMDVWPCPRLSLTTTLAKNAQVSLGLLTRVEKFEVTWENRGPRDPLALTRHLS